MKLKTLRRLTGLMALVIAFATTGCDSWINDGEGDCAVHYKVAFTYTMNMAFADAFPRQVKSVTLYVVDKKGNIVATKTDSGDALAKPGYLMDVEVLPGTYDLLVWAQGESPVANPVAFNIGSGTSIANIDATLPVESTDAGNICRHDITPLFHGLLTDVSFPDTYGNRTVATVDLTKDTNVLQVLLQTIDGTEINPADFSFAISAANTQLAYTNLVTSTTPVQYQPWSVTPTSASSGTTQSRADATPVNGLLAEMSTGRLMADRKPRLIITRNTDGTDIININLIEYLLLVKGEYNRQLTNQQYLDRSDMHTLMFFLDTDHNWYMAAGVYINGWRIVPPQQGSI